MDTKNKQKLSVHRCRFVDFTPSAISALAFPPLPLPRLKKGRVVDPNAKQGSASSSSSTKRKFGTLAVGRANGNIELYEWTGLEHHVKSSQSWSLWKILYGPNPSKVDSLAFSIRHPYLLQTNEVPNLNNLRLFSAGGGSELVEWDLQRGTVMRTIPSQGGAIWSMAVNPASSVLALGCEDGCVRLLSIENDDLSHLRKFDRAKSRLMSIAWGPPSPPQPKVIVRESDEPAGSDSDDDDDDDWSDEWLVTGCSDSSIRKWDVKTGRVIDRMITDKLRKQATLVWSAIALADGTIVSGDSMGDVSFWDSVTCTQLSTFRAHGADVLCLAVSPDGESVFSSGVDQKTSLFSLVRLSSSASSTRSRWVHSLSKRMHAHDVRALAMWPPHSPILLSNGKPPPQLNPHIAPVLASGGLDMCVTLSPCASPSSAAKAAYIRGARTDSVIINPLASNAIPSFEDGVYRRVAYPTGLSPAISLARRADLVVSAKDSSVSLWRIQRKKSDGGLDYPFVKSNDASEESGYEKLLDMELDVTTNICASAISEDGRWLAVSDVYETKLFKLRDIDTSPRPKRIKPLSALLTKHLPRGAQFPAYHGCGASSLAFTPDGSRLIIAAAACGSVLVVELAEGELESEGEVRVLRRFDQHRNRDAVFRGRVVKAMPKGREQQEGQQVNGTANAESDSDEANEPGSDAENNDDGNSQSNSRSPSPAPFDFSSSAPDAPTPLISRLTISTDGQWLASADTHRRIHVFNLDSVSHHAALPSAPQTINAMSFWSAKPPRTRSNNSASAMDVDATASHASTTLLVIAHANNTLAMYDVEARRFPEWAQRVCDAVPATFRRLYDSVQGIMLDPETDASENAITSNEDGGGSDGHADPMSVDGNGDSRNNRDERTPQKKTSQPSTTSSKQSNRIFFWGSSWLCSANLTPTSSTRATPTSTSTPTTHLEPSNPADPQTPSLPGIPSKKRRLIKEKIREHRTLQAMKNRDAANGYGAAFNMYALDNNSTREANRVQKTGTPTPKPVFNIITRYRPMLFADFLSPNELVVVERPLVDLMSTLPPAFFKPKYGT